MACLQTEYTKAFGGCLPQNNHVGEEDGHQLHSAVTVWGEKEAKAGN